jgi:hypothetical protein
MPKPGLVPRPQPQLPINPPPTRPTLPINPPPTRPTLPTRPEIRPTPLPLPSRPEVRPTPLPLPSRPEIRPTPLPIPGRPSVVAPILLPGRPGAIIAPMPLPTYPVYRPNVPWGGWFRPYSGGVYWGYGWVAGGSGFIWGNYYCGRYYSGWHTGFWNGYFYFGTGFVPRPVPLGWLLAANANWIYANPYYVAPPVATTVNFYNYSQPIPTVAQQEAPSEAPAAAPANNNDAAGEKAAALLDRARDEFKANDFAAARATVEAAVAELPNDPTLHEFRALCLFAERKFTEASAAIYAVLAAGPGWNGETMIGLYDKPETYVGQLSQLEQYATANPKSAEAQFLLGYHSLVIGEKPNAVIALNNAVRLQPKDTLSAELLTKLNE